MSKSFKHVISLSDSETVISNNMLAHEDGEIETAYGKLGYYRTMDIAHCVMNYCGGLTVKDWNKVVVAELPWTAEYYAYGKLFTQDGKYHNLMPLIENNSNQLKIFSMGTGYDVTNANFCLDIVFTIKR